MIVLLPLVLVLGVVGVVYAARHRPQHVTATGSVTGTAHHAEPISSAGRWSLIVLAAALVVWSLTFATLPIYYAAAIAGAAFVLAVVATVRDHDRSPLLLVPLIFVPLSAVLSAAFVLLS